MNSANLHRDLFLSSAEVRLRDGLQDAAIDLAKERLLDLPGDIDAQMILCRAHLARGDFDEARRSLAGIEAVISGIPLIYARMSDLCRKMGLDKEAQSYYRKSAVSSPDIDHTRPANMEAHAGSYTSDEETDAGAGQDAYADIGDLSPDFHTVTLVKLYIEQGHLGMAEDVLEEMLRRDESNREASELLRIVRVKRGGGPLSQGPQELIAKLTRWMQNIDRIRVHAS